MSRKNKGPQTPEGYVGHVDISSIGAPPAPQVNLLPAEVKARQAMGGIRLRALLIVVLVVAVVAIVLVSSMLSLASAEAELAEKEARIEALQTEMAQYSEVPRVKGKLQDAKNVREFATSAEFYWADYLRAIEAVSPEDWTLTDFAATVPAPMEDPTVNPNPIGTPAVATLTFTGRAASVPDVAAWLEGMATIPGLSDPHVSSTQINEEDGTVFYETIASVQVTPAALVSRFAAEGEEADDA